MSTYLSHVKGGLVVLTVVGVFVVGMMFEAKHQFGIEQPGVTTTPTTALASAHETTTTVAPAGNPKPGPQ